MQLRNELCSFSKFKFERRYKLGLINYKNRQRKISIYVIGYNRRSQKQKQHHRNTSSDDAEKTYSKIFSFLNIQGITLKKRFHLILFRVSPSRVFVSPKLYNIEVKLFSEFNFISETSISENGRPQTSNLKLRKQNLSIVWQRHTKFVHHLYFKQNNKKKKNINCKTHLEQ